MKKIIFLIVLLVSLTVSAKEITFQWDANIEKDLAGYKLYQSSQKDGNYIQIGKDIGKTEVTIEVADGEWYWYVTAFNQSGLESDPSNNVTMIVNSKSPQPPKNFIMEMIINLINRIF